MAETRKDVIRETDAEAVRLAKTLVRSARFGALAVIEPGTGAPLASRVGVATDMDGAPLILVSMLSA
ncbi:MAG: HugZ family protein, partial [Mesorhizobium sp.]